MRVSKPSVRAMWLARCVRAAIGRTSGHRFKALGAGDVAREVGSAASRAARTRHSFKALGAGDVARERRSRTDAMSVSDTVSKPSVRAMWLARVGTMPAEPSDVACFKALGAGDVAREASAGNCRHRHGPSVSKPSVRAMWLARASDCLDGLRCHCVSKPSVRAMWLARWRPAFAELPDLGGFKALGAGDVARELSMASDANHAASMFQSPRCGRCGSRGCSRLGYVAIRTGFKALGAGDVAREWSTSSAGMIRLLLFQSPRCGRCGSRGG